MSNLEKEIRQFLKENYVSIGEMEELNADQSLVEQGIIDSISVYTLIDFIEQTYSISVSDDEITPENLDALNRIVAFITKKTSLYNLNAV